MITLRKNHESPKTTLLSFAESSNILNRVMKKYDKTQFALRFSPTFNRNWTLSPKKHQRKLSPLSLKESPKKIEIVKYDEEMIDKYIKKVIAENKLEEIELKERYVIRKNNFRKNAFDRYFEENGEEEEKKLINYINNCSMYE